MHFGFSYVGLIFLIMLFVPNFFWTKHKPKDYDKYRASWWVLWLAAALILMILYEIFWIRYFRSEKTMKDFYRGIIGIPVAGASLPVVAVLLIAIYGGNPFLLAAGIILGIGHIGIHLQHRKEVYECEKGDENTDEEQFPSGRRSP